MEVWYDSRKDPGKRITKTRLTNGKKIEAKQTYILVVSDFLAAGGSGFAMLKGVPATPVGMTDLDALITYLKVVPQPVDAPAGGPIPPGALMVDPTLRAFVNERPVTVPRGRPGPGCGRRALDLRLADQVQAGEAYVTDARGIQVAGDDPVGEAGAVYRVVGVGARPGGAALSKDALRRWPKVELHVHLDGCLRPATMIELARMQGVTLPADTPDELARKLSVKGAKNASGGVSRLVRHHALGDADASGAGAHRMLRVRAGRGGRKTCATSRCATRRSCTGLR